MNSEILKHTLHHPLAHLNFRGAIRRAGEIANTNNPVLVTLQLERKDGKAMEGINEMYWDYYLSLLVTSATESFRISRRIAHNDTGFNDKVKDKVLRRVNKLNERLKNFNLSSNVFKYTYTQDMGSNYSVVSTTPWMNKD